ncbi:MAG: CcmD family protein [Cyclobacteriaceae bacterium]|nr:CcmD family protein [Cyclobacteriaceae bacterium]
MKRFRIISLVALVLGTLESFSQSPEKVEMADILRQDGKIYTVVAGILIILTAMIILLIRVDRRISKIEKKLPPGSHS